MRFVVEVYSERERDAAATAAELSDVADGVGRGDEVEDSRKQRFAVGSGDEAGGVETKGERGEFAAVGDSGKRFARGSAFDEACEVACKAGRKIRGGEQGEGVVCCGSPQRVEFCLGIGQTGFAQALQPLFAETEGFLRSVLCVVHEL